MMIFVCTLCLLFGFVSSSIVSVHITPFLYSHLYLFSTSIYRIYYTFTTTHFYSGLIIHDSKL